MVTPPLQIAIIDMYDGEPNLGKRCIHAILEKWSKARNIEIKSTIFRLRNYVEIPDDDFDIYISTGGPGSPLDSKHLDWDNLYTAWLEKMVQMGKPVFLICHSFQIACRHFEIGTVSLRKSSQVGILPVHPLIADSLFDHLQDPFYALESRHYQITEPNDEKIKKIGAEILALEKIRPNIPLERAIMAVKFTEKMYGVQFHPEAEPDTLSTFFNEASTKKSIVHEFGIEKWEQIILHLNDPNTLETTYANFIPNFLDKAIQE